MKIETKTGCVRDYGWSLLIIISVSSVTTTFSTGEDPGEVKWVNFHPPFFEPLFNYADAQTSNISTRLWLYYIITKIHPPLQSPGSAPARLEWMAMYMNHRSCKCTQTSTVWPTASFDIKRVTLFLVREQDLISLRTNKHFHPRLSRKGRSRVGTQSSYITCSSLVSYAAVLCRSSRNSTTQKKNAAEVNTSSSLPLLLSPLNSFSLIPD